MDETCNMKIQRLEIITEEQGKRLDQQEQTITSQGESLQKITQLLSQVRWMLSGGLAVYLISSTGLEGLIKTFFKLLLGA